MPLNCFDTVIFLYFAIFKEKMDENSLEMREILRKD